MTYEETRQILGLLKTNYPSSFKGWSKEDGQRFLKLWSEAFQNMPFEFVKKAVISIVLEDTREFYPNIGQVNARMKKLITKSTEEEASEAWESIRRFILNYHQDDYYEHYNELPERARKVIKVYDLKDLANGDSKTINVERTMFMKRYSSVKESEEATAITNGKLLEIADKEKLNQIGLSSLAMQIETSGKETTDR